MLSLKKIVVTIVIFFTSTVYSDESVVEISKNIETYSSEISKEFFYDYPYEMDRYSYEIEVKANNATFFEALLKVSRDLKNDYYKLYQRLYKDVQRIVVHECKSKNVLNPTPSVLTLKLYIRTRPTENSTLIGVSEIWGWGGYKEEKSYTYKNGNTSVRIGLESRWTCGGKMADPDAILLLELIKSPELEKAQKLILEHRKKRGNVHE